MIIKLYMKTPGALEYALEEAVERDLSNDGIRPMDARYDDEKSNRVENAKRLMERWIKFGEIAWLEFDTDTGTATVLETGRPNR